MPRVQGGDGDLAAQKTSAAEKKNVHTPSMRMFRLQVAVFRYW